jgi:hypothetical protein
MIAYSKDIFEPRFNPVLGSSYEMDEKPRGKSGKVYYTITFISSNGNERFWHFSTLEAAQQTIEWLDQLYGVKFIPSQILETENKQ